MKKENFNLTILIFLAVVFSLSATYAYLELSPGAASATGQGGCFNVNYNVSDTEGEDIDKLEITALQSTTNYLEGASANITLSKNENCEIYTQALIYIHTNSSSTTAPLCYETTSENYTPSGCSMKYKIMQGESEVSSGIINAVTADSEDQLLATIDLDTDPTTYTIYLWIDSSISGGSYHNTTYSGYFYASSTQSSTVTE